MLQDRSSDDLDERVLILAPARHDAPALAAILEQAEITPALCKTLSDLCHEIDRGAGAVLIAEEAVATRRKVAELKAALDRQETWSELTVLLIGSPSARRARRPAADRIGGYGDVVLLGRPLRPTLLVSALRSALKGRRRQQQIRDHLLDRARHEDELRRRQDAERVLQQVQKMEAIGQLTGGIAHDFNNLLMVISGGLDMLDRAVDPSRRDRLMTGMRQAAARGQALTSQLLAFSRRITLSPQAVNLRSLVDSMRILVGGALRGDIAVDIQIEDELWPVLADSTQLELALLNLAGNARDAMPAGGLLTIRAANVRMDDAQPGGLKGEFVRIEVRDTGSGIPPEILGRVFDPFFTTKPVGKGTGLGLSQVYGFANQSGGQARIETALGQGTAVILYLPKAEPQTEEQPLPAAPSRPGAVMGQSRTVLVVEDNDEVAELATQMLEALGFSVQRAASAKEALGRFETGPGVDLVFSDVVMPGGMNGIELARELKRRRPDLPVLLTSGYSDAVRELDPREGLPLIEKPYRLDVLQAALQDVGGLASLRGGTTPPSLSKH